MSQHLYWASLKFQTELPNIQLDILEIKQLFTLIFKYAFREIILEVQNY